MWLMTAPRTKPAFKPAAPPDAKPATEEKAATPRKDKEIGGPAGPEPTRYGDWERNGRCVDF